MPCHPHPLSLLVTPGHCLSLLVTPLSLLVTLCHCLSAQAVSHLNPCIRSCALTQQTQAVIALLPLALSDLSDVSAVVRVQLVVLTLSCIALPSSQLDT